MRVIIAGSRGITNYRLVVEAMGRIRSQVTEVVSGVCPNSPDLLGERWALENGIPIKRFAADWEKHGKPAGMIRNAEMADYGDALVAIWDGQSRGTDNMIAAMATRSKKYYRPNILEWNIPLQAPGRTKVVNIKSGVAYDVYIGRPGKGVPSDWGNKFIVGQHGNRNMVIALCQEDVFRRGLVERIRRELAGKTLGCFCKPKACHGDIYAGIADT